MVTSPVVQVPVDSLDLSGVTLATLPRNSAHPRYGTIYSPTAYAGTAPVWLHPLGVPNRFIMVSSRIWTAGVVEGSPSVYSDYDEKLTPTWIILDGPTGSRSAVPGYSTDIPMVSKGVSSVQVVAGASRPPNLMFLLNSAVIGGQTQGVLQRFHVEPNWGSVTIGAEEILPRLGKRSDDSTWVTLPAALPTGVTITKTVTFTQGMQYDNPRLALYGTDDDGKLYRIHKGWGRVGYNTARTTSIAKRTANDQVGNTPGWEYYIGTGYAAEPTDLAPVTDASGTTIVTNGPLSFGSFRNSTVMTTVGNIGGTRSGHFWLSRSGMSFFHTGSPVPLGAGASYMGGTIQLMPQLATNPTATAMTANGVLSGILYVTTVRTGTTDQSLVPAWDIFPLRA